MISRSGGTGSLLLTGADQHKSTGKTRRPSLPHGIALGARQCGRLRFDYYFVCGLLPSVAQPPWPLQAFLPGFSPPPWPLQSFCPLHACLGRGVFSASAIVWRETPAWLGVLAA